MAALIAALGAGILCAAERGETAATTSPAGAAERPEAAPLAVAPVPVVSASGVQIVAPESGARVRGITLVQAQWGNPSGYVIFRVDNQFAYATTPPYEMRWDTSTAPDGDHTITVDAYDAMGGHLSTSSIRLLVENVIPTPADGVLLTVRFGEHDLLTRRVVGRGEISALAADEALPPTFEVLAGELRGDVSQAVLDSAYEGISALVRNRLRTAALMVDGVSQSLPELGQYAMVQISRNGLAIPATAAVTKPRLGLGEISLGLPDYPVFPGDVWESPIGAVCDLYSRRAVFVMARHTFEGLRWFRDQECAVVTSSYSITELPLYEGAQQFASAVGAGDYTLSLTGGMMGMRGGMRGSRGGGAGGRGGGRRAAGGAAAAGRAGTQAPGGAATGRRATAGTLESARLISLEGTRRTYVGRQTGVVLRTEDTILGKVEFRAAQQAASASGLSRYELDLTGGMMMGARGGRGGGGGRGARAGGAGGGAGGAGAQRRAGAGRAAGAAAAPARGAGLQGAGRIPARLDYGFRLTNDLVAR
jgi:hypothetical protein